MTRTALILFVLLFHTFSGGTWKETWAGEVVVIQSAGLEPYNKALQGIQEEFARAVPTSGPKAITAHTLRSHILAETGNQGKLRQEIIQQNPDLVLVIGSSSLSFMKGITGIPVVYLMVPFPDLIAGAQENITGIDMNIGPERELEQLTLAMPRVKHIGVLYDPARTGEVVRKAQEYASRNNLNLIALPVGDASEVPGGLNQLKSRIEWFWMLPDLTVLTPQTVDFIMLFSLENRVPILTFSQKYLEMGAVLAVTTDPHDMGRQAAELGLRIMARRNGSGMAPVRVRNVIVGTNHEAAGMLGVPLQEDAVSE